MRKKRRPHGLACIYQTKTNPGFAPVPLVTLDNPADRTVFAPATDHSNVCPINFRW